MRSIRPKLAAALLAAGLAGAAGAAAPDLPGAVPGIVDAPDAVPVVVRTADGAVRGAGTPRGQAFLGIPFAAPPIAALRFAPPQPVARWTGVRDARRLGLACMQPSPNAGPTGEDCLNLNVFAPHDAGPRSRLPVMVWLYGGALITGANAEFDLSDLAERQHVIVVAPNYRLGAFGFFAHPALRGTGEGAYATLDQQAALRWVHGNIAGFGGDAGRVTIFGESAGAQSACMQLVLSGAAKLVHGAILQSDTCIFPDTSTPQADAEQGGLAMAKDLGCADAADAVECLRAVPAARLLAAVSHRRGNGGLNSWAPMTGGDVLPRTPRQIYAAGAAARVPVLIGSTHDEATGFTARLVGMGVLDDPKGYEYKVGWAIPGDVAPMLAEYAAVARESFAEAYFGILTASHFACPVLSFNRLARGAPVYAYEFDDPNAPVPPGARPAKPLRAYHGSELAYVFRRPVALAGQFDAGQQALAARMQDAWGNFARTGAPGDDWAAFDGRRPYLLAPVRRGLVEDFGARHHCAFWNAHGF